MRGKYVNVRATLRSKIIHLVTVKECHGEKINTPALQIILNQQPRGLLDS